MDEAAALREMRRTGDWSGLRADAVLTPTNLAVLIEVDGDDARLINAQLSAASIKTIGALMTAAIRIIEDPTTGMFNAKGDVVAVTVPGGLRQIAAFRDRVNAARVQPENPNHVSMEVARLLMQYGWIWKKGSGQGLFGRRNWTRRYLMLDMTNPRYLYYLKYKPEGRSALRTWEGVREIARGRIDLMHAAVHTATILPRHRNRTVRGGPEFHIRCFNAHGQLLRTYCIVTETKNDFDMWVKTLTYITWTLADFFKRRKAEAAATTTVVVDV